MGALSSWWASVGPNLEASVMWALPGFVVHHVLTRRHITRETDRQTEDIKAHIDSKGRPS